MPGEKKCSTAALRLIGDVDLAFPQALDQRLGRQIDQLDLVGVLKHAVGHGFPHPDAGDAFDDVVQAFQMLDVQRGQDVDAGFEDFLHVLVSA